MREVSNAKAYEKIRDTLLLPLEEKNHDLMTREHPETNTNRDDYQRDFTRILYSSAFRRLQGKMQLLNIESTRFFRNRLTHSLEVAQIARSIAEDIGYNPSDAYIVDACSLAHDIGNPPFGHYGEKVLSEILVSKKLEGFEGNAQTMRIVRVLQQKKPNYKGLNLTKRTLLGLVKHFDTFKDNQQKFLYEDDYKYIKTISNYYNISLNTLDAQIMDISDEIAYAAHDLEDALRDRIFTIDEFLSEYEKIRATKEGYNKSRDLLLFRVDKAKEKAKSSIKNIPEMEYNSIFAKELTSSLINTLINDIDLIDNKNIGFRDYSELANGLKYVIIKCVNHRNNVKLYEAQGEKIIKGLFEVYCSNPDFMSQEYRFYNNKSELFRNIVDYIAGMMDSYAISEYQKYYGDDMLNHLMYT